MFQNDRQHHEAAQEDRGGDRVEPADRHRRIALEQGVLGILRIVVDRHLGADAVMVERLLETATGDVADADARAAKDAIAQRVLVFDIGDVADLHHIRLLPLMLRAQRRSHDATARRRPRRGMAHLGSLPQDHAGDRHRQRHEEQRHDDVAGQEDGGHGQRRTAGRQPPELPRQVVGAGLQAEPAERDQQHAQKARDRGAEAHRITCGGRGRVLDRGGAAPHIDRQRGRPFLGEGARHRLRHAARHLDRLVAGRRPYREAGVADPDLVGQRFERRVGRIDMHRRVEGAGHAGIVALGGGRELDGRGHAPGHPGRHGVAHRPQHEGEHQQADADHHPLADRRFLGDARRATV